LGEISVHLGEISVHLGEISVHLGLDLLCFGLHHMFTGGGPFIFILVHNHHVVDRYFGCGVS